MNIDVASLKLALKERDVDEIEEYFTALERDLDHNQQLLKEQQEEHHLELIALERLRVQQRMEWEREWREREEALLSTLKSTLVSRERLMVDIRSYSAPLVSIKHLAEEGKPNKWWFHKKPEAAPDAPQSDSSSIASKETKEEEFNLQELIKLEERVRKAEAKKLLKVQKKAEKKAKEAERSRAKEEKQMEKKDGGERDAHPKRFWNILTLCCATSASGD